MNMDEFNKSVEDIIIYPGGLDELNQAYGQNYKVLPLEGSQKYLTGLLIPDFTTYIDEVMLPIRSLAYLNTKAKEADFSEFTPSELSEGIKGITDMMGEAIIPKIDLVKEFLLQMKDNDIRVKAKSMGASGLIHLRFMMENSLDTGGLIEGINSIRFSFYSGVPVYQKKE